MVSENPDTTRRYDFDRISRDPYIQAIVARAPELSDDAKISLAELMRAADDGNRGHQRMPSFGEVADVDESSV